MLKAIEIQKICNKYSVMVQGDCSMIKNGVVLHDSKGQEIVVESVAMGKLF